MKTLASILKNHLITTSDLTADARIFAANTPADLFVGLNADELDLAVNERTVYGEGGDLLDVMLDQIDRVNYAALVNGSNDLELTDNDVYVLCLVLAEEAVALTTA